MSHASEAKVTTTQAKWQAIDWAARSILLAAHLCELAGVLDLGHRLLVIHEEAKQRRDAA